MLHRIAKALHRTAFDQPERQAVNSLFLTHRFGKNWHDIAWMGETPDDLRDQRKALQRLVEAPEIKAQYTSPLSHRAACKPLSSMGWLAENMSRERLGV